MRAMIAAFALGLAFFGRPAFAEDAKPAESAPVSMYAALVQVELTEDQVQRYIQSFADMSAAMGDAPQDAAEPDAKTMAKLEAIAAKHGFKGFNDYNNVAGNISIVMDGIDPQSKTYVGPQKLIQRSIDEVKAAKDMSEPDKKAALADLQNQLSSAAPIKYKGNIDLVLKHYAELSGG